MTKKIVIEPVNGRQFVVARFERGHYFGEIELLRGGGKSIATARAALDGGAEVAALDQMTFKKLLQASKRVREQVGKVAEERLQEHEEKER